MTTDHPNTTHAAALPEPPKALRVIVAIVAAAVALSTLPWIYLSATGHFGAFEWGMLGYELVTLTGAVYALLLAKGRYRAGWALGVVIIAGSWLVALLFGFFIAFVKAKRVDFPELLTLSDVTLYGRAAAIAVMTLTAALAVFSRRAACFKYAAGAALWASPLIAAAALISLDTTPGRWIQNLFVHDPNASGGSSAVALIFVGILSIVLISASGHLLIRAFELGAVDRDDTPPPQDA